MKRIGFISGIICLSVGISALIGYYFFKDEGYQITFDTNGGNYISSIKVKEQQKVIRPNDPIKEGYIFDGWYNDKELYNFTEPVTEEITLIAHYHEATLADEFMSLNQTNLGLQVGSSQKLVLTIPKSLVGLKLIWSSSDEQVCSVDENGKVKALKIGVSTIKVETEDKNHYASCVVTVSEDKVRIKEMKISGANEIEVGTTQKLKATIKPKNATNKKVKWSSKNKSIAKVDKYGNVTGIKVGSTTIMAEAEDGSASASYKVNIIASPSENEAVDNNVALVGIKIESEKTNLKVNETLKLKALFDPDNASNKNVIWESSDSKVVSIDSNGLVKGEKIGSATITVKSVDGNHTASIIIIVEE